MSTISNSWKGTEKLWVVFWIHNTLIGSLVVLGFEGLESQGPEWLVLTYALLMVVWGVWLTVAMWRCAFNANWSVWGYLIRALLVLCAGIVLFALGSELFS